MHLNVVQARTGLAWVKSGVRTFWRQPLAMSGLFFIFMALMSLASFLPYLGSALALALLPAATLGLMAASREADSGQFPMPAILISAFRAGRQQARAMLVLGVMYAAGFLLIMAITSLVDGGTFASLYLVGGELTADTLQTPEFQTAVWVSMALYLPLSMMFWHAPALVHWHGVSPLKSLFFSWMACWRNLGAYAVYAVCWFALFMMVGLAMMVLTSLFSPSLFGVLLTPLMLIMASMFFTSFYFTFRDAFGA
jgi:hypothetical protein